MIPSPSSPDALVIPFPIIGQLALPWYGIGYAVAIGVGVWLTVRLARRQGLDVRHVGDALLWVLVGGVIGARLYHVIDQWALYKDDLPRIILPPYSGLALYGGVLGGLVGAWLYTRRHRQPFLPWMDVVVPALFFGQAIARFGNFANQELYGPPTDLPWGILIDCQHRVAAYSCDLYPVGTGFHPLFFYEASLTFLGGLIALLLIARWRGRRDGDLLAFWLIWYGAVRALLETFRLSYDFTFFGLPVAVLFGLGAISAGVLLLVLNHLRPAPLPVPEPVPLADLPSDPPGDPPPSSEREEVTAPPGAPPQADAPR
ncbi:MAG: prolipoprotein diacylglyceryl transferase [Candidatus Limnocylindrales bacterium]